MRKAHASFVAELCGWHIMDYSDSLGADSKARCETRGGCRSANSICRPAHGKKYPRCDSDRFKAGKLPVGMGQILDPAAALSDPGSAAYFTGIRIRDSDPLRKQFK